eukprot:PITA_11185
MRPVNWKFTKGFLVAALGSILLALCVICLGVGSASRSNKEKNENGLVQIDHITRRKSTSKAVHDACSSTLYPDFCASTISSFAGLSDSEGPMEILTVAVNLSIDAVKKENAVARSLSSQPGLDQRQRGALQDCLELFGETLDELYDTLSHLKNARIEPVVQHASDLETLLSAAMTNQYTCLDSSAHYDFRQKLQGGLANISRLISNSLAMVKNISGQASSGAVNSTHNRRLLSDNQDSDFVFRESNGFPSWMSEGERRVLKASTRRIIPDAVVAMDGTGDFMNVIEAVNAAPENSQTRYVIYIKAGVYMENVEVNKTKTNLTFIGDGIDVTVITGNRSVQDGYTTYRSATVAVTGDGFIARDMTFENTAGAENHQAVALRVGSDLAAFYRCSFKGYQDTLYVHSLRQFYRDCDIYGTIDFIFGNAAVVLQNCNLLARRPLANQQIIYTAQGRQDPNENTGISIQNCTVTAASDLVPVKTSFEAYLGRPWRNYSRTVFMKSYLDDLIQPAGWLEWNGSFALSTLYYGEYMNSGPGAGTANRVRWAGYQVIKKSKEAKKFTVSQFIEGNSWLPSTGVRYRSSL